MRFVLLLALALAACAEAAPESQLAGEWTPISTNSCTTEGRVVTFRPERIYYRAGRAEDWIAQVTGFTESPGMVDLKVRPRGQTPGGREELGQEATLRFVVRDGEARVMGESYGGPFTPIEDETMTNIFTMKRCDGAGR
ncbi:hypothetical protein Q0812_10135 [Brevundimonas sp. 2R-24]|uniref:Lipoprotein n=1 Tax=Peiella sedimenti TaxID=3061083 RepID=A0ABT8SMI9_9CAUL|nr:hypothetical protein [Caulobacteraceae bacterium XZ-24]